MERKRKIRGVNYNAEVPFERKPMDYAFDTGLEEEPKPNLDLANMGLKDIEGKMRDE
jgi:pre-mRNA-splicing factor CDC5/CEF1